MFVNKSHVFSFSDHLKTSANSAITGQVNSECIGNRLSATLCPYTLGELTALPTDPLAGLEGPENWGGDEKEKGGGR